MTNVILQGQNLSNSQISASVALETATDTKQSIVHAHFPMFNGVNADGSWKPLPFWHPTQPSTPYFPLKLADDLWARGQLYLMTWATQQLTGRVGMKAADIVAGKYDAYLHDRAREAAAWKHPFVVALNTEFNGAWSSWYMLGPDFAVSWRYIVNLFRKDGATNVGWCWMSNQLGPRGTAQTTAEDKLPDYWPGAEWVDYVGLDTYNWAASRNSPWLTFRQIMTGEGTTWVGNTYGALKKLAPDKPMIVGEFASHTATGDKAAWIKDALARIPTDFPEIMAITWYGIDFGGPTDPLWSLQQADGTARAWEDSIEEGPYIQGGQFVMPPDLQPLKPFTRTIIGSDPLADLAAVRGSLAAAQAQLGTASADLAAATQSLALAKADAADWHRIADEHEAVTLNALAQLQERTLELTGLRGNAKALLDGLVGSTT